MRDCASLNNTSTGVAGVSPAPPTWRPPQLTLAPNRPPGLKQHSAKRDSDSAFATIVGAFDEAAADQFANGFDCNSLAREIAPWRQVLSFEP